MRARESSNIDGKLAPRERIAVGSIITFISPSTFPGRVFSEARHRKYNTCYWNVSRNSIYGALPESEIPLDRERALSISRKSDSNFRTPFGCKRGVTRTPRLSLLQSFVMQRYLSLLNFVGIESKNGHYYNMMNPGTNVS